MRAHTAAKEWRAQISQQQGRRDPGGRRKRMDDDRSFDAAHSTLSHRCEWLTRVGAVAAHVLDCDCLPPRDVCPLVRLIVRIRCAPTASRSKGKEKDRRLSSRSRRDSSRSEREQRIAGTTPLQTTTISASHRSTPPSASPAVGHCSDGNAPHRTAPQPLLRASEQSQPPLATRQPHPAPSLPTRPSPPWVGADNAARSCARIESSRFVTTIAHRTARGHSTARRRIGGPVTWGPVRMHACALNLLATHSKPNSNESNRMDNSGACRRSVGCGEWRRVHRIRRSRLLCFRDQR